ncbi:uncharacterized protein LOC109600614 [Aethina tumida]|uniref:uncharacterized protein LOC109600614 n=1 Tax=Aethina tumida TaxID=116153 RepID=UPI00096B2F94|nr:uncharacterized protein LOC109600614 [Aethina tumida]
MNILILLIGILIINHGTSAIPVQVYGVPSEPTEEPLLTTEHSSESVNKMEPFRISKYRYFVLESLQPFFVYDVPVQPIENSIKPAKLGEVYDEPQEPPSKFYGTPEFVWHLRKKRKLPESLPVDHNQNVPTGSQTSVEVYKIPDGPVPLLGTRLSEKILDEMIKEAMLKAERERKILNHEWVPFD